MGKALALPSRCEAVERRCARHPVRPGHPGLRGIKVRERHRRPGMKIDRDEICDHFRQR